MLKGTLIVVAAQVSAALYVQAPGHITSVWSGAGRTYVEWRSGSDTFEWANLEANSSLGQRKTLPAPFRLIGVDEKGEPLIASEPMQMAGDKQSKLFAEYQAFSINGISGALVSGNLFVNRGSLGRQPVPVDRFTGFTLAADGKLYLLRNELNSLRVEILGSDEPPLTFAGVKLAFPFVSCAATQEGVVALLVSRGTSFQGKVIRHSWFYKPWDTADPIMIHLVALARRDRMRHIATIEIPWPEDLQHPLPLRKHLAVDEKSGRAFVAVDDKLYCFDMSKALPPNQGYQR
ncbi:MAG TPA: hypothetical protein VM328_09510 [Fimbriimonadaceae bacterium]|nr:hypothetical protein [Fimbriimonadaceae bacterium]